jgi:hypothetical protein
VQALDDALAWAERTRAFRAAFLSRCGGLTLGDVRAELQRELAELTAPEADRLAELRLLPVLESIPAVGGKVASRRLMAGAGLAEDVELGDVDDAAWQFLLAGVPE